MVGIWIMKVAGFYFYPLQLELEEKPTIDCRSNFPFSKNSFLPTVKKSSLALVLQHNCLRSKNQSWKRHFPTPFLPFYLNLHNTYVKIQLLSCQSLILPTAPEHTTVWFFSQKAQPHRCGENKRLGFVKSGIESRVPWREIANHGRKQRYLGFVEKR